MELIARNAQLSRLEELLQRALRGQMQIALISGDAGAGKTALVDALVERCLRLRPELFVARSQCYQVAGATQEPYTPFVQVLDEIVGAKRSNAKWDQLRHSLVDLAPDWLEYLPGANLSAGMVRTVQFDDAADERSASADRQRRMVQFANAMRLASYTSPMLLVIDNVQWTDRATLDLLSFLVDQLAMTPILLLLLYRPTDIAYRLHGEAHPVRRTLSQWNRLPRCVEIPVPEFNKEETLAYLRQQKMALPEALVEQLWQRTHGNPLFMREYLQLLRARGLLHDCEGQWNLLPGSQAPEVPENLDAVIQQRLDLLADDLGGLLSHASAYSERFASRVLASGATPEAESRIFKYLNQLEDDFRLVSEVEDQGLVVRVGPEFRFVHALLQQVLYQELSEGQRRLLHQVIGRMLESLYGDEVNQHAEALAGHFEMGGKPGRAILYYLQACQNALADQSLVQALELAHKTQALARRLQPTERRATQWLIQSLLQEAEIHFWKGDYRSAITATYEGKKLSDLNELPELHAHFHYWASRALRALGQISESIDSARQALQILGEHANPRLRGLLHAYLGSVSDSLPVEELNQHLIKALGIADTSQLHDVKVKALLEMAGLSMFRTDRPSDALNFARQAARIAGEHGMYNEQVSALRQEAFAYLRLGQFEDALSHDQKAVEVARQHRMPIALHLALFSLALSWSAGMDNPARGLELLHESLDVARQHNFTPSRNIFGAQFNIAFSLGRWDEAHEAQERFYQTIRNAYPRGLGYHLRMQGHELFALGQYNEAAEAYRSAIEMYRKYSPDSRDTRTVEAYLGLAMVESGDALSALPLLEDVSDFWKGRQPSRYARALCALAEYHLQRSDCEQAIPLLRQALVAVERSAADQPWPIRPQVSLALARALLLNREKEEALAHAQWAYERYKRMGHFLLGDSAYWMGQVYSHMSRADLARPYFLEAGQKWAELRLTQRLRWLEEPPPAAR